MKIFQFQRNSLIYSIYQTNKVVQCDLALKLKVNNLTFPQSLVMATLFFENREDLGPKDLEYSLDISKSALSQIISQLESKQYIKRCINEDDARSFRIILTSRGKKISRKMISDFDAIEKKVEKGLLKSKRKAFLSMFQSIIQGWY